MQRKKHRPDLNCHFLLVCPCLHCNVNSGETLTKEDQDPVLHAQALQRVRHAFVAERGHCGCRGPPPLGSRLLHRLRQADWHASRLRQRCSLEQLPEETGLHGALLVLVQQLTHACRKQRLLALVQDAETPENTSPFLNSYPQLLPLQNKMLSAKCHCPDTKLQSANRTKKQARKIA